ncbi:MAG: hypothetical protein ABIV21_06035, partial [Pyrinomonadaceae bacterium]
MSDEFNTKHTDEAELVPLDADASDEVMPELTRTTSVGPWAITFGIVAMIALVVIALIVFKKSGSSETKVDAETTAAKPESENASQQEVRLTPEVLASAGIETETVTQRPAIALLTVAGTVEANPEQTQQVTSLVNGRIERVFVSV